MRIGVSDDLPPAKRLTSTERTPMATGLRKMTYSVEEAATVLGVFTSNTISTW
jgi:hypothetical protein